MAELYSNIPQLSVEQEGILRRRKIAEMLQAQSLEATPNRIPQRGFASDTAMPDAITKIAQAYFGAQAGKTADADQKALGEKYSGLKDTAIDKFKTAYSPVPATPEKPFTPDMMPGEESPFGNLVGQEAVAGRERTVDEKRQAVIQAMTSPYKEVQATGTAFGNFDQQDATKEAVRLAAIEAGKVRNDDKLAQIAAAAAGRAEGPSKIVQSRVMDENPKSPTFGKPIIIDATTNRRIGLDSGLDTGAQGAAAKAKSIGQGEATAITTDKAGVTGANKALKGMGYDPATGEDKVTKLLKKATGGLIGTGVDSVAGAFNYTTEGKAANNNLTATANSVVMDMMGGKLGSGISNADRDFVTGQLGLVGDSHQPRDARLDAWTSARSRLIEKGAGEVKAASPANASAVGETRTLPDGRKMIKTSSGWVPQ